MSRFVVGGQEGDQGFEFLWFAEPDLDLSAASEAFDPDRQFDGFADESRGFVELIWRRGTSFGRGMGSDPRVGEHLTNELLGLSDGELLLPHLACQLRHLLFVLQTEQRAGVTLGDLPVAQESLDVLRQVHEAQGIGDRGPALAEPARELVFAQPEPVHEGPVGRGGLEGAQVLPLQIFYERQLHGLVLVGLPYKDGYPIQAPLTHGSGPRRPRPSTLLRRCSWARRALWASRSWGLRSASRSSALWCGRRAPRKRNAPLRPPGGPGSCASR